MIKKSKIIAIIPARGGSKGIPGKNIIPLAGIPLVAHTINAAKNSKYIGRTIVSTDSERIASEAEAYGADVIMRLKSLALDTTPTEPVMKHVLDVLSEKEGYHPDHVILLQPTSPLRTSEDIDGAFSQYFSGAYDSLLSVCSSHAFIWQKKNGFGVPFNYDFRNRPRRQEMQQYRENGAIYITTRKVFLKTNNRLGGKIGLYEMDENRSVEIDTPFDLLIIEHLLENRPVSGGEVSLNDGLLKTIKKLKMLITDVDGVLTDGGMYYSHRGETMKLFNTKDGMGLELLRKKGLQVAIMTKEKSDIVIRRAEKLKVSEVHVGVKDKLGLTRKLAAKYEIKMDEICYIGDDINDLKVLKNIGLPVAVSNAVAEVKAVASFITRFEGGKGAVREVCDLIIRRGGA